MAGPGSILIKIGADAGQAVRELGTVDKALGSTMSTHEKMSAGLKKAALPAAAALGAIGYAAIDATKAAMEDAAAQDHLAGVLKRTAGATDAQIKAVEASISSMSRATGVADDELRPAFETLVTATGSVSKANKEMKAALDISAASGKSVEDVSKAMALAHTGQTAKLEKLIPGLSEAAKKSDDMATIMGELSKKTKGAAADAAGTAAGQFKIFQTQVGELQESLGAALLPVISAVAPIMLKLADAAGANTKVITILVAVVAGLAGAILVANAALKVYETAQIAVTAAQWLWNAAMDANPLGLIVLALAALGVALVIAYKKSATFRAVVQGALGAVKGAVDALEAAFSTLRTTAANVFNWVSEHWKLALFAFGPLGAAVYLISSNFDAIKGAAQGAYNWVTGAWKKGSFAFGAVEDAVSGIAGAFHAVHDWAQTAYGYVTKAWTLANLSLGPIKDAVQAIADAFKHIDTWAGNAWSTVKAFVAWMADNFKIPKVHLPHIPGTRSLVAAPASYSLAGVGARAGASPPQSGAGVTINVYGAVDPEGTARAIRRVLARHDRRQGRTV